MQSISVKVNDSVQTIAEARVITKDGQPTIIKANRNANYELINDATGRGPDHIVTKRVGKDLHVSFEENAEESDLIIETSMTMTNQHSSDKPKAVNTTTTCQIPVLPKTM